jgi:hypothetical protein
VRPFPATIGAVTICEPTRTHGQRIGQDTRRSGAVQALVVYESFWGNTAAIARAIADGIDGASPWTGAQDRS